MARSAQYETMLSEGARFVDRDQRNLSNLLALTTAPTKPVLMRARSLAVILQKSLSVPQFKDARLVGSII